MITVTPQREDAIERQRRSSREWKRRNKAQVHAYKLKARYDLTPEQLQKMEADQKGLCAICGCKPTKLVIDHDHKTGKVRALLCKLCNVLLGAAKELESTLKAAADYLEKHRG